MRHQDLTINHRLESWVFANHAALIAAGTYVSGDIGRIGFQTDTGQYWRLITATPTWQLVEGVAPAVFQGITANLTGTNSPQPTFVCGGVPGTITPVSTGRLLLSGTGHAFNDTANSGWAIELLYGTGAKPANGAAIPVGAVSTGGIAAYYGTGLPANIRAPFCVTAVVTGLTLGIPYWLDLGIETVSTGTMTFGATSITAIEF